MTHYEVEQVVDASTLRLMRHPEFEILRTVVITNTVLVVDVLFWPEATAEDLLHDQPVFSNGLAIHHPHAVTVGVEMTLTAGRDWPNRLAHVLAVRLAAVVRIAHRSGTDPADRASGAAVNGADAEFGSVLPPRLV